MYAIVDIETTGSFAAANGITEISIHIFDGDKVVEKFETLINPFQSIPRYIQSMTGITDEMVSGAPGFKEVAGQIHALLEDKIFVAHNVNFDYSFIKYQLEYCGFSFNTKKLCTVRLSRKILPGFESYSLGNLSRSLGIRIRNRHRAGGDAEATVELFRHLLANDQDNFIGKSLKKNSKEQLLPPHVPKSDLDKLPYSPGVYYFHDKKGKVVYVGKAKNIRYRVNSHFSNNSSGRQKQNFIQHVYAISFQETGTELMAAVLESTEIKKIWPIFNSSQKRWENVYGIFTYEDQNGYTRLAIEKNKKILQPVHSFHYLIEGHSLLRSLIHQYQLCPRLCFMQSDTVACTGLDTGQCFGACEAKEEPESYNKRVQEAIGSIQQNESFIILDRGLNGSDQSCILVEEGKFIGMGYIPIDVQVLHIEQVKDFIQPYKENSYVRNLLLGFRSKYPDKVIVLEQQDRH
ncbi:MAG: DNA polymerase III subunit epsilon [Terrimonas sp.]|nr:DNA polymerase III subunit epsilon [Terrimonas sp.]